MARKAGNRKTTSSPSGSNRDLTLHPNTIVRGDVLRAMRTNVR